MSLNAETTEQSESSCRVSGGESGRLTEAGMTYSLDLAKYIYTRQETVSMQDLDREVLVLAGTAKVHSETMLHLRNLFSCYNTPLLNELRGGDMHGLSHDEVKVGIEQRTLIRLDICCD